MTITKRAIAIATLVFAFTGCTLVTDFDDSEGGSLYTISEHLDTAVTVSVGSGDNGSLTLTFDEALPAPGEGDDSLLALLADGTISITVSNDETSVSYDLTDGERVDATPASAGEYQLALNEARTSLTVTFFNDYEGHSIHAGGDYSVVIDVLSNNYFELETISIITVTVN